VVALARARLAAKAEKDAHEEIMRSRPAGGGGDAEFFSFTDF
jgi:hypothetical protein